MNKYLIKIKTYRVILKAIKIILAVVLALVLAIILFPKTYDGLKAIYSQLSQVTGTGFSISQTLNNTIFIMMIIEILLFFGINFIILSVILFKQEKSLHTIEQMIYARMEKEDGEQIQKH